MQFSTLASWNNVPLEVIIGNASSELLTESIDIFESVHQEMKLFICSKLQPLVKQNSCFANSLTVDPRGCSAQPISKSHRECVFLFQSPISDPGLPFSLQVAISTVCSYLSLNKTILESYSFSECEKKPRRWGKVCCFIWNSRLLSLSCVWVSYFSKMTHAKYFSLKGRLTYKNLPKKLELLKGVL